jgi:hypothetical protein
MEALMRGMILVTALCALSTMACAEPFKVGEPIVANKSIICDTKEQVMDIFSGSKVDGGRGIQPIYHKYRDMSNDKGEPVCAIQAVAGPVVKSIQDLGETHGFDGDTVHGWLVEVTGQAGQTGWVLFGELVKSAPPGLDI